MDSWIMEVHMRPLYPEDTGVVRSQHEDFSSAQKSGRNMACCRGTLTVKIISPTGEVHCTYDRADNYWRNTHPDSQALQEEQIKKILNELKSPEYQAQQRERALQNLRKNSVNH